MGLDSEQGAITVPVPLAVGAAGKAVRWHGLRTWGSKQKIGQGDLLQLRVPVPQHLSVQFCLPVHALNATHAAGLLQTGKHVSGQARWVWKSGCRDLRP